MSDAPPAEDDAPIIRDRRRFDPVTGEPRHVDPPSSESSKSPASPPVVPTLDEGAGPDDVRAELAERVADLQRLQAEYANYRRRIERDRQAVGEAALASVLIGLLPVLDDIDRARSHGEVEGGFKLVADGLEATLGKLGLDRYGEEGEPFDPTLHEALTHGYSAEVSGPVCAQVFQPGYRVGDRILRPARVAVLEPEQSPPDSPGEPAPEPETAPAE